MPQTIQGVKGQDFLKTLQAQVSIKPDQVYHIDIYTDDERRFGKEKLKTIMWLGRKQAKESGMTPKDIDQILGKIVSATF